MRTASIVLALVALFGVAPATSAAAPEPGVAPDVRNAHVRALTPGAAALLADGTARCPVVRALVDALGRTDVVVYLTDRSASGRRTLAAYLSYLTTAGGLRYLVVHVDRWLAAPWDRIPYLAHELQHAVEIAGSPEVRDAASLSQFYLRIGWESGTKCFESGQAREAGSLARRQLFDPSR